ncbi:MAG: oligosaccharide flippase family protein [Bacteroidota bacterium]
MIKRFSKQLAGKLPSRKLLLRTATAFGLRMGGIFFSYLFTVLVTNKWGKEGAGTFAISLSLTVWFITFGKLGFDTLFLRLSAYHESRGEMALVKALHRKALQMIVPWCVVLTVIYYFGVGYICTYKYHKPELTAYMQVAALYILPNVLLIINTEGLRGLKMVNHYMVLQFMGIYLLNCLIIAALYYSNVSVETIIIAHVTSLTMAWLASMWFWERKIKGLNSAGEKVTTGGIFAAGRPLMWSGIMMALISAVDGIILPLYCTTGEVGLYANCLKISNFVLFPLLAVVSGAAPAFSRLQGPENRAALQHFVLQTGKVVALISVPFSLALCLFSGIVLKTLFGPEFTEAAPVLVILSLTALVTCLSGPSDSMLQMTGHERIFRNIIFSAGILSVLLMFVLVPRFGIRGAAFANLAAVSCWNLLSVIFIRRKLGIDMNFLMRLLPAIKNK